MVAMPRAFGHDDLHVVGLYGINRIAVLSLTRMFGDAALGGPSFAEGILVGTQAAKKAVALLVTCVRSGAVTFIVRRLVNEISLIRMDTGSETEGLDLVLTDELGYNL